MQKAAEGGEEGGKVLVMEFCNGGSLFSLIDKAEYGSGLPDPAFLAVLADLGAGLKYLRLHHKVVHRDVKPSNILRTIAKDGQ